MVDVYTLSVIVFFIILAVAIWKDRKNIEFKYVLIMKKSKRGKNFVDKIAKMSPNFWKIFATVGLIISLAIMINSFYGIILTLQSILSGLLNIPAVQLILPIPSAQPITGPAFIGIPFWFWIIIVAIIVFPHELMHGIILRAEKIAIKSVGLLLLLVLPGAFVEPNEKEFKKARLMAKLRVAAAGSFSNFIVSFVLLYLTAYFIWPPFVDDGVVITSVNETAPAGKAGIKPGMILEEINGKEIDANFFKFNEVYSNSLLFRRNTTIDDIKARYAQSIFLDEFSKYKPGDVVTIKVGEKEQNLTLDKHYANQSFPYLGISMTMNSKPGTETEFSILFPLLTLSILLSFAIGLFNILPIFPLDGGLLVQSLTDRFIPRYSKHLVIFITVITLSIIGLSFIGPYIR